jgi:hypothetical protein
MRCEPVRIALFLVKYSLGIVPCLTAPTPCLGWKYACRRAHHFERMSPARLVVIAFIPGYVYLFALNMQTLEPSFPPPPLACRLMLHCSTPLPLALCTAGSKVLHARPSICSGSKMLHDMRAVGIWTDDKGRVLACVGRAMAHNLSR